MKVIEKFKKDKKFRWKVLIFTAIVLFLGITEGKKLGPTEAECNEQNVAGFMITDAAQKTCIAQDCEIQYNTDPGTWIEQAFTSFVDFMIWGLDYRWTTCKLKVETGKYVLADSRGDAASMCAEGRATDTIHDNWFGKDVFMCKAGKAGDVCTSDIQEQIGSILNFIDADLGCKTKFYIVAFGGGFLIMMLFMAVL